MKEETGSLIRIKVEKWYYNCGRHKFIQILTFKGGVLERIKLGEYGTGESDCIGAERRKKANNYRFDTETTQPTSPSVDVTYGHISVLGRPLGAKVYLDGNYKGDIPLTLEYVAVGSHEITVKKNKYKERKNQVLVKQGETVYVKVYLAPEW